MMVSYLGFIEEYASALLSLQFAHFRGDFFTEAWQTDPNPASLRVLARPARSVFRGYQSLRCFATFAVSPRCGFAKRYHFLPSSVFYVSGRSDLCLPRVSIDHPSSPSQTHFGHRSATFMSLQHLDWMRAPGVLRFSLAD